MVSLVFLSEIFDIEMEHALVEETLGILSEYKDSVTHIKFVRFCCRVVCNYNTLVLAYMVDMCFRMSCTIPRAGSQYTIA